MPMKQPPATPKSNTPRPKHASCARYCHDLTSALIRCAYTIRKPDAAPASTNAVQYMSRPKLFGLPFHAAYPITAAIAAGAASGFLMVYAQRMSADVRSWQYLAQLACFGLGVLLFGVAGGCFIGIFTYRRRSSPKTRLNSITGPFVLLHCYGHEFLAFHDRARRLASLGERPK